MLLLMTGCWDRTEINDIAFVMGTSMDLGKDGKILGSVQIAIPPAGQSGLGGSTKEKFFILSAEGKNSSEVIGKLQERLSRRLFYAHRSVIFIGEALARHGVKNVLDHFSRDPRSRLRTFIMVARGREGRELLNVRYPFEQASAEAVREMEVAGTGVGVTMRDLYIVTSSEGISPVMGAIAPAIPSKGMDNSKNKIVRLAGTAVFKDFKLVGYLSSNETRALLWITGKLRTGRITANVGKSGNVGMVLTDTRRIITPELKKGRIEMKVRLEGNGSVFENNTPLDIGQPLNLKVVQKALEETVKKEVRSLILAAQKKYKVDILGFGQMIYRENPRQWNKLKDQWDKRFPQVDVSLSVKLTIQGTGMAGPPLLLPEKEIKKK
jgi:spore germination protein KC